MIDFIENVCQAGCQKALYCKTYARFQVTLWATEIKKISLVSRSWSTVWINMQKMSNGDYFDEKMRRGDRSKEARRISPPLKLLLKSPKLRGSTAPKSAHLHRGREQGEVWGRIEIVKPQLEAILFKDRCICLIRYFCKSIQLLETQLHCLWYFVWSKWTIHFLPGSSVRNEEVLH